MATRVAVITGASSGIGAATAEAFARRGWQLVLGARSIEALEEIATRLRARYGVEAVAMRCDVRREEEVNALVSAALDRFGTLDALVANAGIGFYGRVEETTPADLRELFDINVIGVLNAIRAAVPVMRRQRRGHIAIVSSVAGKRSWPFHGAYSATKFALDGLAQALRAELAGSGVTASLVLPGNVRTPFFERARTVTPGYVPAPIGPVQSAETVAARIVRSVEHPAPEIDTQPLMRPAYVLATAFPRLADAAARLYYSRTIKRLSSAATPRSGRTDDATAATTGTP
jgi:short-subunit dehydrogenase